MVSPPPTAIPCIFLGGWKAVADNLALRIEGDGVSHATVEAALGKMREAGFWENGETRTAIRARVPPFRLSKFQRALPPEVETAFVARSFLDLKWPRGFGGSKQSPKPQSIRGAIRVDGSPRRLGPEKENPPYYRGFSVRGGGIEPPWLLTASTSS